MWPGSILFASGYRRVTHCFKRTPIRALAHVSLGRLIVGMPETVDRSTKRETEKLVRATNNKTAGRWNTVHSSRKELHWWVRIEGCRGKMAIEGNARLLLVKATGCSITHRVEASAYRLVSEIWKSSSLWMNVSRMGTSNCMRGCW